jgi:hypothetical protein
MGGREGVTCDFSRGIKCFLTRLLLLCRGIWAGPTCSRTTSCPLRPCTGQCAVFNVHHWALSPCLSAEGSATLCLRLYVTRSQTDIVQHSFLTQSPHLPFCCQSSIPLSAYTIPFSAYIIPLSAYTKSFSEAQMKLHPSIQRFSPFCPLDSISEPTSFQVLDRSSDVQKQRRQIDIFCDHPSSIPRRSGKRLTKIQTCFFLSPRTFSLTSIHRRTMPAVPTMFSRHHLPSAGIILPSMHC